MNILQIFIQNDLKSWSDIIFAISTSLFNKKIILKISLAANIPCLFSNSTTYEIAIIAKVKANSLQTSFAAIKNQWSMLVYLHIIEQTSIRYEKFYIGNKNIYQYSYFIYSLKITICKKGFKWNCGKNLPLEVLDSYFRFSTQIVGIYNLKI